MMFIAQDFIAARSVCLNRVNGVSGIMAPSQVADQKNTSGSHRSPNDFELTAAVDVGARTCPGIVVLFTAMRLFLSSLGQG